MNNNESVTEEVGQELTRETSTFISAIKGFDWGSLAIEAIITLLKIIVFSLLIYIAYRVLKYLICSFFKRKQNGDRKLGSRYVTLENVSLNILKALAWFFFIYTTLSLLGIPVGTLLAGAGVIGLAVSFGAQGFVSDVINGFRMIFEEQMHVGDTVILDTVEGIVQNVGLQTTVIRDFDGVIHYIPNREIIIVSNKSRSSLRVLIEIPLYAETDLKAVRQVIDQVNAQLVNDFEKVITQKPGKVEFIPYQNSQIAAQTVMYTKPDDVFTIRNKAMEEYMSALTKAGIELPNYTLPRHQA